MAIEIGAVVEGEVTGITNFGAFLQLPEGKVGLGALSPARRGRQPRRGLLHPMFMLKIYTIF